MTGRKYALARWALIALVAGFLLSHALVAVGFSALLSGGEFVTGLIGILGVYVGSNVTQKFSGGSAAPQGPSKVEPQ